MEYKPGLNDPPERSCYRGSSGPLLARNARFAVGVRPVSWLYFGTVKTQNAKRMGLATLERKSSIHTTIHPGLKVCMDVFAAAKPARAKKKGRREAKNGEGVASPSVKKSILRAAGNAEAWVGCHSSRQPISAH